MSIWGLPTSLVQAVAFHHVPSQAIESEFSPLTAVHSANALVHRIADGNDKTPMDAVYLERLGLSAKAASWQNLSEELKTA